MNALPDFETPKLAEAVESLTPDQIDELPYGVIHLDAEETVILINKTEARLSGYDGSK